MHAHRACVHVREYMQVCAATASETSGHMHTHRACVHVHQYMGVCAATSSETSAHMHAHRACMHVRECCECCQAVLSTACVDPSCLQSTVVHHARVFVTGASDPVLARTHALACTLILTLHAQCLPCNHQYSPRSRILKCINISVLQARNRTIAIQVEPTCKHPWGP